jgi:hypothetical protein
MRSGKSLLTVSVVLFLGCGGSDSTQLGPLEDGSAEGSDGPHGDARGDEGGGPPSVRIPRDRGGEGAGVDAGIRVGSADSGDSGQEAGGDGSTAER